MSILLKRLNLDIYIHIHIYNIYLYLFLSFDNRLYIQGRPIEARSKLKKFDLMPIIDLSMASRADFTFLIALMVEFTTTCSVVGFYY